MINQRTIANSFSLKGVGLHSGAEVLLNFKPASEGHGVKVQRIDLEDKPVINADVNRVVSTDRSTTIGSGVATASTVVHLLSDVSLLQIDHLLVASIGPELQIFDGSASPFDLH